MKFANVIVCDEVRIENTGKHIIIGVYTSNIEVPAFPAGLSLSIWAQFYADRDGKIELELRVLANKKEVTRGSGEVDIKDPKEPVTSIFNGIPVPVQDEGMLTFQFREKNGRWKTFKKIPIQKAT